MKVFNETPMIKFHNITKRYGEKTVLENVNLEIPDGSNILITGDSGSGKSTIINLILGEIKPEIGEIEVDGIYINDLTKAELQSYRRTLGVIFEDFKLLPKKTVYENISFALEVCEDKQIEKRVLQAMDIVKITHISDKFPHELSGGEKQKTAIARSLVHNPKVILADEPTGRLDKKSAKDIIGLLNRINGFGVTTIIASHDNIPNTKSFYINNFNLISK